MIRRFPVRQQGNRHDQMIRAMMSLAIHGVSDEDIETVLMKWYWHFVAQGVVETDEQGMRAEIKASLRSTRKKLASEDCPCPIDTQADFIQAVTSMVLDPEVLAMLEWTPSRILDHITSQVIAEGDQHIQTSQEHHHQRKGGTRTLLKRRHWIGVTQTNKT
jgi:hypothetical protein